MTELGPEGRALIEAGRGAFRPTVADRERNLQALRARIADTSGVAHGNPRPPSAGAGGLGWPAISALVVGFALAGGAAVHDLRSNAMSRPELPAPVATTMAVPTTEPSPVTTSPTPDNAPSASPDLAAADKRAASPAHPSDHLAEEVAILSRAEQELHAGRLTSALRLIDEHGRKFPNGTLRQERIAARVHVLCALGRVTEAEAELARLTRLSPDSLHEGSARQACAPSAKN